jgi:hypothetical protein
VVLLTDLLRSRNAQTLQGVISTGQLWSNSAMPKRVFTPATIKIVRELAAQARPAVEIAAAVGSTAGSVRVKCCQLKIPLYRRGRPSLVPTWPEREKLIIYMQAASYDALKRRAARMRKTTGELVEMLLQEIVSSDIYDAVLDEDG